MISEKDIDRVSEATDFVSLVSEVTQVRQKGRDFWCCCPFHKEKTPSCKIDASQNLWHCFGCGEGGSVFTYVMKLHGVDFIEAVRMLADRANIEIEEVKSSGQNSGFKTRLKECCAASVEFFSVQLLRGKSEGAQRARDYLANRKFGSEVAKAWHLGYAPGNGSLIAHLRKSGYSDEEIIKANLATSSQGTLRDRFFNRVMFPIFDISGSCVAFGGRVIGEGNPKYLNSSETPIFHKSNVLFGLDKAKNKMIQSGEAIVVEGYTDVIAMHMAGIDNAVATLGTSLTASHIKLLNRFASKKIIYLFDGDEAGKRAAERALQFIDYSMTPEAGQTRCDLYAVTLPGGLDPAEFIDVHGSEALQDLVFKARPLIEYGISRRMENFDLSTPEGRSRALVSCISILAPIKDSILAKDYAVSIASRLRVSENDALLKLANLRKPNNTVSQIQEKKNSIPETESKSFDAPDLRSSASKNRLANEKEIVSICALFPNLVLEMADLIEQIRWKSNHYKMIIDIILDELSQDLSKTSKQILSELERKIPEAQSVVTEYIGRAEEEARRGLKTSVYSCLIEDCKENIEDLNVRIASGQGAEEAESIISEIQSISEKVVEYTKKRSL